MLLTSLLTTRFGIIKIYEKKTITSRKIQEDVGGIILF